MLATIEMNCFLFIAEIVRQKIEQDRKKIKYEQATVVAQPQQPQQPQPQQIVTVQPQQVQLPPPAHHLPPPPPPVLLTN